MTIGVLRGTMTVVRVLLVEDEAKLANLVARWLHEDGIRTDVTNLGEDALAMAAQTGYDVIVLDLVLPGIDGLETCRRLRDDGVDAPIMMLTARDGVDFRLAGRSVGGDDYLTKPFDFGELSDRLQALAGRRAA
jgi:two-component system, OmpR family, response regulator